ncbi:alpha/beta hydrolase family protein [Brevundimonas lenta]|uniref:Dipeptidyl aminopeptidase/acylaminoacyl peptidase n=1 Tax=Brevundimonas lenta TaxID=424796 RepID=A0A7W6JFR4_9CAUL|nr:S9 family peptidase [Brevundimonas lenta]MBB4084340.1 dipeptidyl aminopeptidase/acylaminoacyl peptidase [Brevundimonas lenta]
MSIRTGFAVAAAAMVLATGAYAQETQRPPLEAYGALPSLELVQISPAGDQLAFVTVIADDRAMLITDLSAGTAAGGLRIGNAKVRDLQWVGEDQVLATTSVTAAIPQLGVPRSEFYMGQIFSIEDRSLLRIFQRNRDVLPIMFGPPRVRQTADGPTIFVRGYSPSNAEDLNLFRVSPGDGLGRVAVDADLDVEDFVLDPEGRPLARSDYNERSRKWTLLLPRNGRLTTAWTVEAPVDSPYLLGQGRSPRTIIVNASREDLAPSEGSGEDGSLSNLFEVNVDTGVWEPLKFDGHPGFLMHHPRTGLLIGSGTTGEDGVTYNFTDPMAARVWAAIDDAFEDGAPELVSWSDDLKQVVVFTSGTGDSGVYRLIDLDNGTAQIVGETYPAIKPEHVGEVRSVHYKAQDGLEIHAYLTLPPGVTDPSNLPLVVLAHGGPASRDVMTFDWWAQALASRGYAVLQPNFRGSTGYGLAFLEAGYGEWGRKMQTDLSDGVRHLVGEGIADPAKVCIVGASYGGYAALAGATLDLGVYRCAVSVAGVSDLRRMVQWEADQGARRDNQTVRYWNRFMGAERTGDRRLDTLSPARLAEQADAPILLLHGKDDTVVPIHQSRIMASALREAGKPYEMIELAGEDHWLSRSETRLRMLAETVRFLEAHNPPQ